ncbi:1012_t:CDS:2 [Entrophospora sp. SA101]|nr:1012_t:CDS:2 [Entrophospora sp. SA101]
MSFHVYQILELGPLQPNEQVFENFTDSRTGAPSTTEDLNTIHQTPSNEITTQHPTHPTPSGEIVLHPSQKFMQVKQKFESYILYQYPCVPCSFCSRLLYPEKAKWTQKIENFECPLIQANLNLRLIENPNPPENHIAVCSSCAYSEYQSIVGTFGYSKNIRSLTLYSGMIGANWLADNNPYLREYKNALVTNSSGSVSSFHTGTHLPDDETAPEFQSGDIIVPHQNFPSEIHNEDSHYSRLIAGFIKNDDSNDDSNSLPVSFDFDHLEALLFPDLFPDGHGDYKEMKSCSRNQQQRIDTYGKYIKQRLLGVDSRLPTAVEIIEESAYMSGWRFSETNASTIPSFIQTGDTYFNQKLMHLNTMIQNLNLPTLFITLSMAEGHWIHLHHILGSSDNFNTVPSNRPLHTTLHFIHRHQNLKRLIWKDPDPIEEMISENVIQSDVPDPNLEPELYECVMRLQIHSCNSKCDGPAPYGERCKKGFPQQFSPHTYADPNNLRYTYRCVNPLDQWVVPYHASTLLIWNAHMNIQYITSRGLAKYINKYIAKPEPSHLFNVKEGDLFREYVHARRLGSMELMFLLLGETICNSSVQVKYIVTDPPSVRSKCILPFSRINLDYDELYWKDLIEKYLAQPNGEPFDNITYKDYIEKYDIKLSAINSKHGELYFYQKLLLRVPARSEEDLIGTYETYRDHYLARFPEEFGNSIKSDQQNQHHQTINMLDQYINLIENLLYSLQSLLTQDIKGIIRSQLENIKILPPIVPNNNTYHYPYFFISGSAGSGKSILINLFAKKFLELNKNFLLMAPTGVAAVNIQGQTIHSALRIWSHGGRHQTLAFADQEFNQEL